MLRLFLKAVESLVAHELFELVSEFAGIDVGRHGVAVRMEAVCHGGGGGGGGERRRRSHRRQLAWIALVLQDGGWMKQWMSYRGIEGSSRSGRCKSMEMDNKISFTCQSTQNDSS